MVKFVRVALMASLLGTLTAATAGPASALVPQANGSLQQQLRLQDELITEIRARGGGAVRRTTVVGPRGGVANRTVVRRGAAVRPGYAGGGVRWARPGWYRWPSGGAIAAGAALGFVTAASAAAWAGAAPAPGMCWYYTDPSRTQGFWDTCLQPTPSGAYAMTLLRRPDIVRNDRPSEDSRTADMVRIPGGTFRMGSNDHYPEEAPVHRVAADGFWIDRTPVTNGQFNEFVKSTGHKTFAEIPLIQKITPARFRTCSTPARWFSRHRHVS